MISEKAESKGMYREDFEYTDSKLNAKDVGKGKAEGVQMGGKAVYQHQAHAGTWHQDMWLVRHLLKPVEA